MRCRARGQSVPGIVALRAQLGGGAEHFGNALGRALVIGGIRHPHMAVVQNGIVRAVSLIDLVERLRDEEAADAVASHKGERRLKEIQPAECRELIEHQQQFALALDAIGTIKRLGEPAADLVEDQAHEWLGAAYVRRRHHQVQRHRPFSGNQIGDAPVAARRDCGYSGVAVEAKNDMAVDSTPDRSLSDLFSTSRAADATTGCGVSPKCFVVIIRCSVSSKGKPGRIGSWRRRAASCLRLHRAHAGSRRPAVHGWSSPNGCASPAHLRDRPRYPQCFARRGLHARRVALPAAGCRRRMPGQWG